MNRYLLDTHVVLNLLLRSAELTDGQNEVLRSRVDKKFISAITFWEISIKHSLGKLDLVGSSPKQVFLECQKLGFHFLPVTSEVTSTYDQLPKFQNHKDPFDRMLVWQAMQYDLSFLSSDTSMPQYASAGLKLA